jgi:TonB family protein
MMSAFTNSLQKPEGFELYVRKFRAICVLHDVQVGSRKDLPGFLQKLVEDRPLAMDFWKLTGKLSNREGGELSDDQMLAVVIEGVTGGESPEQGGEQKQSVDDLRAMLAGVDIQNPGQERTEEAIPSQQIEVVTSRVETAQTREAYESTSKVVPIASATHRSFEEPPLKLKEAEEPRLRPVNASRLVLEPAPLLPTPSLNDDFLVLQKSDSDRIPLEGYSQPEGFGRAISVIAIVLAVAGVAFAGFHYRAPLLQEIVTLTHKGAIQQTKGAAPVQSAPPDTPSQTAVQPEQSSPSPGAPTPLQANPDATKPQAPPLPAQAVLAGGANIGSDRKATDRESASSSSIDQAGAVKVDPAVMEDSLLTSRVPVYPDAAKASRVVGEVIVQALISKEGTVKRVHILQGDSRLRGAAMESVYSRRYSPYLLDGQPVEVTTTITVNFTLSQ